MRVQRSFAGGEARETGILYVVATPIGNLEDITLRAIRVLGEADIIAAEDTRHTRKLLAHLNLPAGRLVSYHEHNREESGRKLIAALKEGRTVALVSDAGTPAVSDPGEDLVRAAVEEGVPVVPVPGASAALAALVASGLPTDEFHFAGFLPRGAREMAERLERLKPLASTLVCYEAPHRLMKTLESMREAWGDRRAVLARELTKVHEEFCRGRLSDILRHLAEHPPKGECVVIVEGASAEEQVPSGGGRWWEALDVPAHVEHYIRQGKDKKEAMRLAARDRGVPRRDIYGELVGKQKSPRGASGGDPNG